MACGLSSTLVSDVTLAFFLGGAAVVVGFMVPGFIQCMAFLILDFRYRLRWQHIGYLYINQFVPKSRESDTYFFVSNFNFIAV